MQEPLLFSKIENAASPDFGVILSKSFDLFKEVWQEALYHTLILMAVIVPFILVLYSPLLILIGIEEGFESFEGFQNLEPNALWFIAYGVFVFVFIIILQALSLGIIASFFNVCKKADLESTEDTGGYFKYLKAPYFQKTFLLSLVTFGITIAAALLCYLPLFYVMVPVSLIRVIYAFNEDLSVSDIIKASFKLGHKFWLIIFGLIIISSLIAQIGMVLCFVGLLVTAFFIHIPIYYLYKDTVGFD